MDLILDLAPAATHTHRLGTAALDPTSWQRSLAILDGKPALWLPRCLQPPDRFYADPFLLRRDGASYLFFESLQRGQAHGILVCTRLAPDGRPGAVEVVLQRDHHLAYPLDLHGPYAPHPGNPIATDVRCARPAGRIFRDRGRWLRPAQDCGGTHT